MFKPIVPFSVNLSKWIAFVLLFIPLAFLADDWKITISKDNYIEVSNFWNNETRMLEIQVVSEDKDVSYTGNIILSGNNPNGLLFPFDFQFSGKDSIPIADSSIWKVTVLFKKNKLATQTFQYQNSTLTTLQIQPFTLLNKNIQQLAIWGTPIDSYKWVDIQGEKLVVRSYLFNPNDTIYFKTYIYLYLFKKSELDDSWILEQKNTDYMLYCKSSIDLLKNVTNIHLTDINCDSIGEIKHGFYTKLNDPDSIKTYRVVLLDQKHKYVANEFYTKKTGASKIVVDVPLTSDELIKRYLYRQMFIKPTNSIDK